MASTLHCMGCNDDYSRPLQWINPPGTEAESFSYYVNGTTLTQSLQQIPAL